VLVELNGEKNWVLAAIIGDKNWVLVALTGEKNTHKTLVGKLEENRHRKTWV
jgi:hypothetical protein